MNLDTASIMSSVLRGKIKVLCHIGGPFLPVDSDVSTAQYNFLRLLCHFEIASSQYNDTMHASSCGPLSWL
jgi:hypothetical protein